jgi:prepilin-type N-terminal cleavage/methylation domain-containing protein
MHNHIKVGQTKPSYTHDRSQSLLVFHRYIVKRLQLAGFTLLEVIVVVAIIGILFASVVPIWTSFMTVQRLNMGQEQILLTMRETQSRAKQSHTIWQASFHSLNGVVQWVSHPASSTPVDSLWSSLDSAIRMDAETTLQQSGGIRKVQFDHEGNVNGQLGRLTISGKVGGKAKRCVIVSTLLGVIRTGREHSTLQDGKACY